MEARYPRSLYAAEVVALPLVIAIFIWYGTLLPRWAWLVLPAWLISSFLLHRDTPKTLGMRADNLGAATSQAAIVFGIFLAALIAIGVALRQPIWPWLHVISVRRQFVYFAFCLLQQVALNSLLTNRLLALVSRRPVVAVCAGLIFATLHWPNPVLVPCTFVAGTAMAWLFARQRNILPLAIGQALLGSVVWWAFPLSWHHQLRVGPAYYLPYRFRLDR